MDFGGGGGFEGGGGGFVRVGSWGSVGEVRLLKAVDGRLELLVAASRESAPALLLPKQQRLRSLEVVVCPFWDRVEDERVGELHLAAELESLGESFVSG